MPDLRQLIGAAALTADTAADVLLTATPDACMAARSFGLGYACVTLPRGASPQETDLSAISSRPLLIWPDAGSAGMKVADSLASVLPEAVIILPPQGVSDGWNLSHAALEGWTADRVRTHIALERQRISDSFESLRRGQPPEEPVNGVNGHDPFGGEEHPDLQEPAKSDDPLSDDKIPFAFLGHIAGEFKYLPHRAQQITSLSAQGHAKLNLMAMAELGWWEQHFPAKEGCSWQAAANWMFAESQRRPVFDPTRIRGRGCWMDNGRVVFHAGDRILADSKEYPISEFPTHFIYEKSVAIGAERAAPLPSVESAKFITLCEMLPWAMPIFGRFLAGWCALAPICGALNWRPHLWLAAPAGTGKSFTMTSVIAPILGSFIKKFLGATSEAGIRQGVRIDAMPVIMDEAESENQRNQMRMQGILELIRQSSSETGGVIAKGTTTGEATLFNVRSCFCLSSIGVSATSRADTSRITILTMEKRKDRGAFDKLVEFANLTSMNPEYCAALRARTMAQIPTILHNAQQFIKAATIRLGDQRSGDQIGTLIAGAFSLTSTKRIDLEFARSWIDEQDWSGFITDPTDSDENMALARLLQAQIRVDAEKGSPWTTTVGDEVAKFYSQTKTPDEVQTAVNVLRLRGMRLDEEGLAVSNTHAFIAEIYRDSAWTGKWRDQLSRIVGAKTSVSIKFNGAANRAVLIPKNQLV